MAPPGRSELRFAPEPGGRHAAEDEADVPQAHRDLASRRTTGKLLLP
jgi:hypothetical protein